MINDSWKQLICFSNPSYFDFFYTLFFLLKTDIDLHLELQAANPMSGKNSLEGTLPTFWVHISIDSSKVVLSFIWEIESFVGIENSSEDS